jgi:predicted NBD/HSP70 family sugar kinase
MSHDATSNHALMKQINRAKVLNAIRVHSPLSRTDIAGYVALDKKSITNFITELSAADLVKEVGKRQTDQGRPFTLLSFHRSRQGVLGISIEPDQVSGALLNLYGEELKSARAEFPVDGNVREILAAVKHVYAELKSGCEKILGVGFAVPGVPELRDDGRFWESINLPGLRDINLDKQLAAVVEETMFFEEASLAKALAEKWFGLGRGLSSFVSIDLGIGVGAGIVHDGRLYRGATGFAGEIGHVVVESGGVRCRCGNKGCLEAYISELRLVAEINKATRKHYKNLSDVEDVSPEIRKILQDAGSRLGLALSYVLNLICPPLIVLNGGLTRFEKVLVPEVWTALRANSLNTYVKKTDVRLSELKNSSALGAASLVLSDIFEVRGHFYV